MTHLSLTRTQVLEGNLFFLATLSFDLDEDRETLALELADNEAQMKAERDRYRAEAAADKKTYTNDTLRRAYVADQMQEPAYQDMAEREERLKKSLGATERWYRLVRDCIRIRTALPQGEAARAHLGPDETNPRPSA
jgi:hypothetical protein